MLAQLTDRELLARTKDIVKQEREILIDVIQHLREIDERRLYSDLKYKSLFEYAVRELGYSEDQAWRRINAMRMTKAVPEVTAKIETGALTLGNLGTANQLFRAEAKVHGSVSINRKIQVLSALENKSRREAEQIVQQMATVPTQSLRPERTKAIDDHVEIRMNVSPKLRQKIDRIRGLLAHKQPNLNTSELLEVLCDQFLTRHEKETRRAPSKPTSPANPPAQPRKGVSIVVGEVDQATLIQPTPRSNDSTSANRKNVSRPIRRQIWRQANGRCQNCGSEHALQIDHIQPRAHGGSNAADNLRLLCRPCNQRAAIVQLGQTTMSVFLRDRGSYSTRDA